MKRLLSLAILFLASLPAWSAPAPQPSQEKIDAFLARVTAAVRANDTQGIKALCDFEGIAPCLVDWKIGYWEILFNTYPADKKAERNAKYAPLEEILSKPTMNAEAIRHMVDPQVRNGHPYALNLPVAGIVTVSFTENASIVFPTGVDAKGDLKFPEWKRTDAPASTAKTAPAPAASPAATVPAPSQKQIDAFLSALSGALQANDHSAFSALVCIDGVPAELVDQEADQMKMILFDYPQKQKATFETPQFTPLEEYLVSLGEGRKAAEDEMKPKAMNGTPFRYTLPIAGMVNIPMKYEHGSGSISRPVGIDATGALKFVTLRPDPR